MATSSSQCNLIGYSVAVGSICAQSKDRAAAAFLFFIFLTNPQISPLAELQITPLGEDNYQPAFSC